MNALPDIILNGLTNKNILVNIGQFIKQKRLAKNKTQDQLAKEAGIARCTLSLLEKGENVNLIVFIQVLRALKELRYLEEFQVSAQPISPLLLLKLEKKKKVRASHKRKSTTIQNDTTN